jgi:hypothetical protein
MSAQPKKEKTTKKRATADGGKTNWSAVQNRQPPGPWRLRVDGDPRMPTPQHKPVLTKAVPQGINPRILILDLKATPPTGGAPQVVTRVPVHYEERSNQEYDQVDIRSQVNTEPGALVSVEVVQ